MRLHIGQPPATPDFTPQEDGWTPLKEPSPWVLNLIATPIGFLAAGLIALGWGPSSVHIEFRSSGSSVFEMLAPLIYIAAVFGLGFPALIAVHELIHTLCYPKFGFTQSTMIAVWPSKMLVLAITLNALRRNRYLLVYLMPFLVISILPLIVCRSLGTNSTILVLASTANSLFAGGDIFYFFLILFQVPRHAILRNQGWTTWWKAVDRLSG